MSDNVFIFGNTKVQEKGNKKNNKTSRGKQEKKQQKSKQKQKQTIIIIKKTNLQIIIGFCDLNLQIFN